MGHDRIPASAGMGIGEEREGTPGGASRRLAPAPKERTTTGDPDRTTGDPDRTTGDWIPAPDQVRGRLFASMTFGSSRIGTLGRSWPPIR